MSDSDDNYFSDDFVLDDRTLALLDKEESKFKRTTNNQTQAAQQSVGPPTKRQKTTNSWQPQLVNRVAHRADTLDDMDDLPDVSIRQDGTYGLQDKPRRPSGPPSRAGIASGPSVVAQTGPGTRPATTAPVSRGPAVPVRSASVAGPVRASQVPSRPPSAARATRIAQSPASSQEISRTQSGPPQQVNRVPSTTTSNNYVQQLLQQIEELRKEKKSIHASMESALEAKFAKEGEVTILRKRLEKTAQEHLVQVVKLKAAKEEADSKHVVLQKQYEADKERLRTELTFRRHELETSSRKYSVVSLPKNDISRPAESTSFQMQRLSQWGSAGPSRLAPETPRLPRFGVISDFEKAKKATGPETRDLPSGFQTSTPCSPSMVGRRVKEPTPFFNAPVIPSASQGLGDRFPPSQPQLDVFGSQMDDGGPAEDFILPVDGGNEDIHMVDEGTPVMTLPFQENTVVLTLPSWNLVLHDIMLTHTLQGLKLPTLQLLVCASPTDTSQIQSYSAVLMRIFDALGGIPTHPDGDFDNLAQIVCRALCEVTELLAKSNLMSPLTAVLNLLTNLTCILPSIHAALLSQRSLDHNETPQLLGVLYNITQDQLQKLDITSGNESPELCSLGKETLLLYEALVCWISDGLEDRLSACPSMASSLMALLHPHRPSWFLVESMRVLLWLSTRQNLSRSLLTHPACERTGINSGPVDPAENPHTGLLCSLVTDTDRQGPEADELKSRIIMFFGMLSNANPESYSLLVESQELIPSIVLYICHLAAQIWDENEVTLDDPQAATRTIRSINHATLLLQHLVIGEDATLDLRERLLHAPQKTYQGLIHGFILAFGRLSYANPPYWLDKENRQRLAEVADLARVLLERVIQGPELDLIWETYQDEGEDNEAAMDVDDDEVEAQKIADS